MKSQLQVQNGSFECDQNGRGIERNGERNGELNVVIVIRRIQCERLNVEFY